MDLSIDVKKVTAQMFTVGNVKQISSVFYIENLLEE